MKKGILELLVRSMMRLYEVAKTKSEWVLS